METRIETQIIASYEANQTNYYGKTERASYIEVCGHKLIVPAKYSNTELEFALDRLIWALGHSKRFKEVYFWDPDTSGDVRKQLITVDDKSIEIPEDATITLWYSTVKPVEILEGPNEYGSTVFTYHHVWEKWVYSPKDGYAEPISREVIINPNLERDYIRLLGYKPEPKLKHYSEFREDWV